MTVDHCIPKCFQSRVLGNTFALGRVKRNILLGRNTTPIHVFLNSFSDKTNSPGVERRVFWDENSLKKITKKD